MPGYQIQIYWDGEKPRIQYREKFIEWLSTLPKDIWVTGEVNVIGSLNNTPQSKLYFTWCDLIAQEFGWDSGSEVHDFLKTRYNNGKSTKSFDTKQWSEYMIKVQAFASESNIKLPTGNENN